MGEKNFMKTVRTSLLLLACLAGTNLTAAPAFSQCMQDAATTPEAFVKNFYDWYTDKKAPEKNYESVLQKKTCFAPGLLKWMEMERAASGKCPDDLFLDYDPIISTNGFGPSEVSYQIGKAEVQANTAKVPVKISYPGGISKPENVVVALVKSQYWQIADFALPAAKTSFEKVLSSQQAQLEKCLRKK